MPVTAPAASGRHLVACLPAARRRPPPKPRGCPAAAPARCRRVRLPVAGPPAPAAVRRRHLGCPTAVAVFPGFFRPDPVPGTCPPRRPPAACPPEDCPAADHRPARVGASTGASVPTDRHRFVRCRAPAAPAATPVRAAAACRRAEACSCPAALDRRPDSCRCQRRPRDRRSAGPHRRSAGPGMIRPRPALRLRPSDHHHCRRCRRRSGRRHDPRSAPDRGSPAVAPHGVALPHRRAAPAIPSPPDWRARADCRWPPPGTRARCRAWPPVVRAADASRPADSCSAPRAVPLPAARPRPAAESPAGRSPGRSQDRSPARGLARDCPAARAPPSPPAPRWSPPAPGLESPRCDAPASPSRPARASRPMNAAERRAGRTRHRAWFVRRSCAG